MKIAKFEYNNKISYGIVNGMEITRIEGGIFDAYNLTKDTYSIEGVKLLPPVDPPNIIAIGLNYKNHAYETGLKIPERPVIFLKATTSITAAESDIVLTSAAPDEVDYECELAVIIGKKAKNVSEENALDYVFGYTCSNDVSARDCQKRFDVQWARAKSFDTFCPLGPWIETDMEPDSAYIETRLNGKVMQSSGTSDMIFTVRKIISYLSANMTLLPGTVILTGTPHGIGDARKPSIYLKEGDIIEIEIDKIGVLRNTVRNE